MSCHLVMLLFHLRVIVMEAVTSVFTCIVSRQKVQNVAVRHAGERPPGSQEEVCRPLQTTGGGRAAHPVLAGRRDPDREHGRAHIGM